MSKPSLLEVETSELTHRSRFGQRSMDGYASCALYDALKADGCIMIPAPTEERNRSEYPKPRDPRVGLGR